MLETCGGHCVALPVFALWREADFRANPDAARLIAQRGMGWNVVEFKPGSFAREGLTLFTLRMGDWLELGAGRGRLYAETAILAEDGQRAPHHYLAKTEDIVNRGDARFVVELFKVDAHSAPLRADKRRGGSKDTRGQSRAGGEGRKKSGKTPAPPKQEPEGKTQRNVTDPEPHAFDQGQLHSQAAVDAEAPIIVAHGLTRA
jgi:D-lyxose ketol-isomerase